jgi:hypothetical protein
MSKQMTKKMICTAKINYNAYNTWLEPYIGWEVGVFRVTKRTVLFNQWLMQICSPKIDKSLKLVKYNREVFDIE